MNPRCPPGLVLQHTLQIAHRIYVSLNPTLLLIFSKFHTRHSFPKDRSAMDVYGSIHKRNCKVASCWKCLQIGRDSVHCQQLAFDLHAQSHPTSVCVHLRVGIYMWVCPNGDKSREIESFMKLSKLGGMEDFQPQAGSLRGTEFRLQLFLS